MRATSKQRLIMTEVLNAADRGVFLTLQGLRDVLPYSASTQAIRCSVRYLESYEALVTERDGRELLIKPTQKTYLFR